LQGLKKNQKKPFAPAKSYFPDITMVTSDMTKGRRFLKIIPAGCLQKGQVREFYGDEGGGEGVICSRRGKPNSVRPDICSLTISDSVRYFRVL